MELHARVELSNLVRWIHANGWAPGTGGNFGMVIDRSPLRILMTPSGVDKGEVKPQDLLVVDRGGVVLVPNGLGAKPSAETLLHVALAEVLNANVILHTHTIWNSLASLSGGHEYRVTGYEMLKGLQGVTSHEHEEVIPVFENSQDIPALAELFRERLHENPRVHAVLLKGHGMYTWGTNIQEARRHLEILEFLFELNERAKRREL